MQETQPTRSRRFESFHVWMMHDLWAARQAAARKLNLRNLRRTRIGSEGRGPGDDARTDAQTGLCYAFGQKAISRCGDRPASSQVPGFDSAAAASHDSPACLDHFGHCYLIIVAL
jgi:hypothetical protein